MKTLMIFRSTIALALIFFVAVQAPLTARRQHGALVEVQLHGNRLVRGELLRVQPDSLLVYEKTTDRETSIRLDQVRTVRVLRKSKFVPGLILGGGAGFLIGHAIHVDPETLLGPPVFLVPLGLISGAIIGSTAGTDKKLTWYAATPQQRNLYLKTLKRYSRDR